ncbi:hypothetical protein ACLB1O_17795 [Escherichia coli]
MSARSCIPKGTNSWANRTAQLPRLKADAEAGKSMVIDRPRMEVNLRDLADNEKALILAARFNGIAIDENSEGTKCLPRRYLGKDVDARAEPRNGGYLQREQNQRTASARLTTLSTH